MYLFSSLLPATSLKNNSPGVDHSRFIHQSLINNNHGSCLYH